MWYVFKDGDGSCIVSSDAEPDPVDLALRNEIAVYSDDCLPLHEAMLEQGVVVRRQPRSLLLDELKQLKKQQLNEERDLRETGGFLFEGRMMDSDVRSMQRIWSAAQSACLAVGPMRFETTEWVCADNTICILNQDQLINLADALAEHISKLHQLARQLKQQVDAALTAEQVAAIDWPDNQDNNLTGGD